MSSWEHGSRGSLKKHELTWVASTFMLSLLTAPTHFIVTVFKDNELLNIALAVNLGPQHE